MTPRAVLIGSVVAAIVIGVGVLLASDDDTSNASHRIDPGLTVARAPLPGLDGGPARAVEALVAPDGTREEFVADEIILRVDDPTALDGFLAMTGGEVVRSSAARSPTGERTTSEDGDGWYLVRVEAPPRSATDVDRVLGAIAPGSWRASSDAILDLLTLVAEHRGRLDIGLNPIATQSDCAVCEHPIPDGNLDAATWWWMDDDTGLGIGVVRAWEYLRYQGFPPTEAYYPVTVAIVDSGFDLDESTGLPNHNGPDYPAGRPAQLDEIDGDWTAGGEATGFANCSGNCWHAQQTFGVCCGNAGNGFGAAGSSGGATAGARIESLLIRVGADTWTIAVGVHDALYNNAEVIITNVNLDCGSVCRWLDDGNYLAAKVRSAPAHGAVVVAPSGNAREGEDLGSKDMYPCELTGVICVGAVQYDPATDTVAPWAGSNWGEPVDVWAPTGLLSAVTRSTSGRGGIDDIAVMGGTSCAAPFAGGIVAVLMALGPDASAIAPALAATAIPVPGTRAERGYVNALGALMHLVPNADPTLGFVDPVPGAVLPRTGASLRADVDDPEKRGPWGDEFELSIEFVSDVDGPLCGATSTYASLGCMTGPLSVGDHRITATAVDAFGGTGAATIHVTVADAPPVASITWPHDGDELPATAVQLVGYGFDPDTAVPDSALTWVSSVSGAIGSGSSLWVDLVPGEHTITLVVRSEGIESSTSVTITILPDPGFPEVRILAPDHLALVEPGSEVRFEGNAVDPEDGALTGTSLQWVSDIDGPIGYGTTIDVPLSGATCDSTVHTITLVAIDSDGHRAEHRILVNVVEIC